MKTRASVKAVCVRAVGFATLGVSVFLCVSAIGCGADKGMSTVPPPPVSGTLTVNVAGLPAGTAATITVNGPNGYSDTISETTTLTGLAAGAYSFTAPILPPTGSTSLTIPTYGTNPATVSAGRSTTANVTYASLPLNWTSIGPSHIYTNFLSGSYGAGQIGAIAAVNNGGIAPTTIYVGCAGFAGPPSATGVYKTTDGGNTWTPANTGLTDPGVAALWVDQTDPNIVVAGTTTTGLFRSTDAGETWQAVQTIFGTTAAGVTTPGQTVALLQVGTSLYAGTAAGIAVSQDSGATWTLEEATQSAVTGLTSSGTYLYAALSYPYNSVLVQSQPGAPWVAGAILPFGGANSISADPADPLKALVVEQGYYQTPDLWITSDAGNPSVANSWTAVDPTVVGPAQYVAYDPSDTTGNTIYTGSDFFFGGSDDGGATWEPLTSAGDLRIIVPEFGGVKGLTVAGSDQGIYSTTDGGNTWTSMNGNLTTSLPYWMDMVGDTIFLAMQDYAPIISFDAGQTWTASWGNAQICGEGGMVSINPGNPRYIYDWGGACGFWVSTDGGKNFQTVPILNAPQYPGGQGQLIAVDAQSPSHVYVGAQAWNGVAQGIYESTDYGVDYTLKWPTVQVPSLIAIDPTNDRNIFIGAEDGSLQVSHDGGTTWTTSMIGTPGTATAVASWPVSFSVNPALPKSVMIGMSGPPQQATGGVLYSGDGGDTFLSASTGLGPNPLLYPQPWPDPLVLASYDPGGSGLAALARWDGIYLSSDNGAHWFSAHGNAVPVTFTSVKWASNSLYATTFGQGIVKLPIP